MCLSCALWDNHSSRKSKLFCGGFDIGKLKIWILTKVFCLRLFWKLSRMLNLDWNVDACKKKKLFTWLFLISINFVDWWNKNWSMKENKNHNTSKSLIYSKIKMGCLNIQTADRITRLDFAFNILIAKRLSWFWPTCKPRFSNKHSLRWAYTLLIEKCKT